MNNETNPLNGAIPKKKINRESCSPADLADRPVKVMRLDNR